MDDNVPAIDFKGITQVDGAEELNKLIAEEKEREARAKARYKEVTFWPEELLAKKLKPVTEVTDEILDQIQHMKDVVRDLDGVGIAANQLGYDNMICVCWFGAREDYDMVVMINPEITLLTGGMDKMKEACFSLPNCVAEINRHTVVEVTWEDEDGFKESERFEDWDARIVQHELDHLNGCTIHNKMNQVDKMANRIPLENLMLRAGRLPKRLKRKGLRFK